ncbi:ABC transporter substrate-binding protein [Intrasporangium mesophilum]
MSVDTSRAAGAARPSGAYLHGLRRRRVGAALATGALVGALGFAAGVPSASAATETTLRVGLSTEISTLNPFLAYFDGELNTFGDIYPALTSLDINGKPGPYLADSWTTSSDKLTWTFKIHGGLTWSDGQPLTAKDVAWTFNKIMTDEAAATANGSLVSKFESVTAPDDTTVVIKTKSPQANMLYVSVPISGIPIVPQHVWEKVSSIKDFKNTTLPIVGYGPWQLSDYKADQYVQFKANPDFFLGAPKFDRLIMTDYKNGDAAIAALKKGDIDNVGGLSATQYAALSKEKGITTYQQTGSSWTAVEVNVGAQTRSGKAIGTGNPALKDPQLRLAIATAIDRDQLVQKVLEGAGLPGAAYVPPGLSQFAWAPSAEKKVSFDVAKANQILDAAGYTKGADGVRVDPKTGKALDLRLGIHSDDTDDAQISNYLVSWLQQIGIKLTPQAMSFSQLNENLAKGDWDLLMDGWGTGPDPSYLLSIQTCGTLPLDDGSGGNTDAFHCNPAYDSLYDQQVGEFDAAKRTALIGQMQDILYDANADIILYYKNQMGAFRSDRVSDYVVGQKNEQGLYPTQTTYWSHKSAAPVSAEEASNTGLYVGLGIVVLVLLAGGAIVVARRRGTADERE